MAHSQLIARIEDQKIDAERLAKTSPFNNKPLVEVLDLSSGWDSMAKFDVVINRLKRLKLYSKNLVFCPARWREIDQLGFTMKDLEGERNIQGATEAYIRGFDPDRNFPSKMCLISDFPTLIVFKADVLRGHDSRYYPLGDLRDAAVIIFLLTSDDF